MKNSKKDPIPFSDCSEVEYILVYFNTKKCTRCGVEKDLSEFNKDKNRKDGLSAWCRSCKKEHYEADKERILAVNKEYRDNHKEEIAAMNKEYYENNVEEIRIKNKTYRENNREEIAAAKKEHYEKNRETILPKHKEYRDSHKEEIAKTKKEWCEKNKDHVTLKKKEWYESNKEKVMGTIMYRYHNDIIFKLKHLLRTRVNSAIKRGQKSGSFVQDLGCSIESLKEYLEAQFTEGMTWDNWGSGPGNWNLDHIIPLSSFDLEDRDQFLKACHYTNLQPLWFEENMKKGSKLNYFAEVA